MIKNNPTSIIEEIIDCYKKNKINPKDFELKIKDLKFHSSINTKNGLINIEPIGEIVFPYYELGLVKSVDLINFYEMVMFAFYWKSKSSYKRVADVGSNIGLHSIILSKCGFYVEAFEPDQNTSKILKSNLELNNINNVKIHNKAISGFDGKAEFVKINNNVTGSHILGSKKIIYGDIKKYEVEVIPLSKLCNHFDLIKLDIEGAEDNAILSLVKKDINKTDIIVEIHSYEKSKKIFEHLKKEKIRCFAQKNNWIEVKSPEQMPKDYTEGALFISLKPIIW
jgi:FkbM family methyltransferase